MSNSVLAKFGIQHDLVVSLNRVQEGYEVDGVKCVTYFWKGTLVVDRRSEVVDSFLCWKEKPLNTKDLEEKVKENPRDRAARVKLAQAIRAQEMITKDISHDWEIALARPAFAVFNGRMLLLVDLNEGTKPWAYLAIVPLEENKILENHALWSYYTDKSLVAFTNATRTVLVERQGKKYLYSLAIEKVSEPEETIIEWSIDALPGVKLIDDTGSNDDSNGHKDILPENELPLEVQEFDAKLKACHMPTTMCGKTAVS